jgi:release factor glutamine methyltransferase
LKPPKTIHAALGDARSRLASAGVDEPAREARSLLALAAELSAAQVLARSSDLLAPAVRRRFLALVERRAAREPFAYLAGEREFFGRAFQVDSRVLIPRPETEHLVEAVLALPRPEQPRWLDLGTGSGAIAVTLALECPAARVVATDLSPGALAVARGNARDLAAPVRFVGADLGDGLAIGDFDVVASNPPYVALAEAASLPPDVRDHEPAVALYGGNDGSAVLARLLALGPRLRRGAFLVVEIGCGQADRISADAEAAGWLVAERVADLAGIERVVVLRRT